MKLTKLNAKFYKISNLLPDKYGVLPSTDEAIKMLAYNQKLLTQSSICFDTLQVLKQERNKNVRNYFGDQLSERIPNPDGCGTITEAEYCRNQGMIPLCVNVIRAQNAYQTCTANTFNAADNTSAPSHVAFRFRCSTISRNATNNPNAAEQCPSRQ